MLNTYLCAQHERDKLFEFHCVDLEKRSAQEKWEDHKHGVPPPSLTLAPTQMIAVMENGERMRRLSGPL